MQKVTYTNARGTSLIIMDTPYRLLNMDGFGEADADLQTQQAPYQDGSTLIDVILKDRPINIEVGIFAENELDLMSKRRSFSSIFNPKINSGTLRYENDFGVWEIGVELDNVPQYPNGRDNQTQKFQRALLNFIAPNPYWKSTEITSEPMSAWIGLFTLPFTLPTIIGTQGSSQTFMNNGDVDVPIMIEFHGPAANPCVTNETTGSFVKINRELTTDDVLMLNTDSQDLYVTKNGDNVFNWVDKSSMITSMVLVPGENLIMYSADSGTAQGIAKLTWRERYVGV